MEWPKLINDTRFGLEDYADPKRGYARTDFRRDYDRLVFSSPFRRLQNKTQVFPLPGSVFVHNRLTHSLEVSSVGKSLADEVAALLRQKYGDREWADIFYHFGDIVAAACLAHDLGNPPFGHSGEKAISTYFSEGAGNQLRHFYTDEQWSDLTHFEGNANTFRTLTHTFKGRRRGGFAMTYTMLASIVKYPYQSVLSGDKGKFGFFEAEKADFRKIFDTLGILRLSDNPVKYARHPLVYIVEAADDICYEVMDLEDAHKLKILTTDTVIDTLMDYFSDDNNRMERMKETMSRVDDPNEKISYLRSCVVGKLVECCAHAFVDNETAILEGRFDGSLLDNIAETQHRAYRRTAELSWRKIYTAPDVVDVELAGNRIITYLMDKLMHAVINPELNYSRLLLSRIPTQYDTANPDIYERTLAVLDHLSAMTDVYALDLYRKLNGMSLPAV
ncbi:MAG: dNTP triphosphohydrolase [Muribaculaceae bacterium]|nr:dNTP triphosphohydrolase [Muribaculaceae bacterium]